MIELTKAPYNIERGEQGTEHPAVKHELVQRLFPAE